MSTNRGKFIWMAGLLLERCLVKKQIEVKSVLWKVLPTLIAVALYGAALAQTEGYTGHSTGLTGGTNIGNGLEGTNVVNSLFGGAYWSMDGFDWGLQGRVNLSNLNPANLNSGSIFGGQANLLARVPLGDILRQFALNLIKRDPSKGSIRNKRKRAAWDLPFLESLVLNLNPVFLA